MNDKVVYDLVSGELVLINSVRSRAATLNDVCRRHNLPEPFTPLSAPAALKHALLRDAVRTDNVVRGTARSNRYEVLHETKKDVHNKYRSLATWQIDTKTWTVSRVANDGTTTPDDAMTANVAAWRGIILAGTITGKLVQLMQKRFHATRMRHNGGAYFVPGSVRKTWGAFVADLRKAGLKIQRIQTSHDDDSIAAIVDNSCLDLQKRYEQLFDELEQLSLKEDMDESAKLKRMQKLEADLREVQATATAIAKSIGGAAALETKIVDEIDGRLALALI